MKKYNFFKNIKYYKQDKRYFNKYYYLLFLLVLICVCLFRKQTVVENYYNLFTPTIDNDISLKADTDIYKYTNDIFKYQYYYKLVRFGLNTHNYLVTSQTDFITKLVKNILAYSNIVNTTVKPFSIAYQICDGISSGSIDIGITSTPVLMKIFNENLLKNIEYVSNLDYHYIYVITNKFTDITSLSQFKNKKINLGIPNTTSAICADNILYNMGLSAYGDYIPSNYNTDIALRRLANNELDIVFFTDTYPSKYLEKHNINEVYRIVPIKGFDNEIFTARYAYYRPTYFYNDIPTYKFSNVVICNKNTNSVITYHTIKQIFTGNYNNTFQPKYPDIKESIYIPLHEGARKYLIEKGHISLIDHKNCPYLIGNKMCTVKDLKNMHIHDTTIIKNDKTGNYDTRILKNKLLM